MFLVFMDQVKMKQYRIFYDLQTGVIHSTLPVTFSQETDNSIISNFNIRIDQWRVNVETKQLEPI